MVRNCEGGACEGPYNAVVEGIIYRKIDQRLCDRVFFVELFRLIRLHWRAVAASRCPKLLALAETHAQHSRSNTHTY